MEPAKSQIIAPGKKRENDITPQVIEREKTVIHPSNKTNTTYPTVKPVFDWLFWADSFVVSQKLSFEQLSAKYAYRFIIQKANEMGLVSRKKLSSPDLVKLKPLSEFRKLTAELAPFSKGKMPTLRYNLDRYKPKKVSMPKIGYIDLSPVKGEEEGIEGKWGKTPKSSQKSNWIQTQNKSEVWIVDDQEMSELYGEMSLVRLLG